jgi:hypothetical protein
VTDPLIDRDAVRAIVYDRVRLVRHVGNMNYVADTAADAVLAYLRSVLTPEALDPAYGPDHEEGAIPVSLTGAGLHRRIFGMTR